MRSCRVVRMYARSRNCHIHERANYHNDPSIQVAQPHGDNQRDDGRELLGISIRSESMSSKVVVLGRTRPPTAGTSPRQRDSHSDSPSLISPLSHSSGLVYKRTHMRAAPAREGKSPKSPRRQNKDRNIPDLNCVRLPGEKHQSACEYPMPSHLGHGPCNGLTTVVKSSIRAGIQHSPDPFDISIFIIRKEARRHLQQARELSRGAVRPCTTL